MGTATQRLQHHQSGTPPVRLRRYAVGFALIAAFIIALFLIQDTAGQHPTLGLSLAQDPTNGAWLVTGISFNSDAAEAGAKVGDVVRLVDGDLPARAEFATPDTATRATQITLERPTTGETITVGLLGHSPHAVNMLPYLFIGIIFFAVGAITFLLGRGEASRVLTLLCCTGALETIILPLEFRQVQWALLLNGICVPIFMGSFAYLFLVFPTRRQLRIRSRRLHPSWVLAPGLVASSTYIAAQLDSAPGPTFLSISRLTGYPYFLACLIGGVVALFASWRQTKTERESAQLRVIVLGTILAVVPLLLLNLLPFSLLRRTLVPAELTVLPLALIPIAFGYAILRYQVMNMHLFVRRGLVYSALGVIITGIYALALAVGTTFVRDRTKNLDTVLVPAMVALVVILGDRLRAFMQSYVDRLFDRQGYDYRRQLLEFSRRMNGILDPDELAQSSVDLIAQTMGARHVRLYLHDRGAGAYRLWVNAGVPVALNDQVLGQHHTTITELRAARWEIVQHFEIRTEEDSLLVPLVHKGQPVALLTLGLKHADLPYSSEDLALLGTVASQLAIATENAQLYGRMRDLYLSGIRTLAATVDAKDSYTHGHSERVAAYARAIATALELPQLEIETIELAGMLHDIGKIGVPDAILQKPGRLDPDERTLIEQHADLGAHILSDNPALMPLVPLVRHHHERYDGRGYPSGLRGDDIPLGAAIICVADTYDTMTTDRPYRRAPGIEEARAEIARCSGVQFNPRVVEAFVQASTSPQWRAAPQQKATDLPQTRTLGDQASEINSRAMRVVYQIAQMIGTVTDLPSFLERVIDLLRRELGTKVISIFLVDQATGALYEQSAPIEGLGPIAIPTGGGLVGWVAEHQKAVCLDDTREDPRVLFFDGWEGRSELTVPLISNGRTVAVLNAESTRVGAFSEDDTTLLTIIAGQLAQVIEVAHLHDEARRAARLDGLTGVANHRHFYERLEAEIAHAQQEERALSLALLDVDGLKALNDTHGHLAGDGALQTIARLLTEYSQPDELIARYGGDEFAILFPGLSAMAAGERAQVLLEMIRAAGVFEVMGQTFALPEVSTGIATFGPEADRAITLVALADAQMYRQKVTRRVARGQRPLAPSESTLRLASRPTLPASRDTGQPAKRAVAGVGAAAEK